MKATGMIRRIDELGRVVIPKEIRKTMRIRDGEELEIFTNESEELVIKKYSRFKGLEEHSAEYCGAVENTVGGTVLLADNEKIIAAAGKLKREYLGKTLSKEMTKLIDMRKPSAFDYQSVTAVVDGDNKSYLSEYVMPIMERGELFGAFIVLSDDRQIKESVVKVTETATKFLALTISV